MHCLGLWLWDTNSLSPSISCLLWGGISKGEKILILSTASKGCLVGEEKIFEASAMED